MLVPENPSPANKKLPENDFPYSFSCLSHWK